MCVHLGRLMELEGLPPISVRAVHLRSGNSIEDFAVIGQNNHRFFFFFFREVLRVRYFSKRGKWKKRVWWCRVEFFRVVFPPSGNIIKRGLAHACCLVLRSSPFFFFGFSWRVYAPEIPTRIFTPNCARSNNNSNNSNHPKDNNNRSNILRVLWWLLFQQSPSKTDPSPR